MSADSLAAALVGGAFIFIFLLLALCIVLFVLNGLGRSYVLKQLGSDNSWVGWIPYVGPICLGLQLRDSDGNLSVFGSNVNGTLVALWPVYNVVLSYVPGAGLFLSLAACVILGGSVYSAAYAKMENKDIKQTNVIGYITGLFGIVATVKFLIYRSHGDKPQQPDLSFGTEI